MLDAFTHERGTLYPSWQDNPRLKWGRALRELNLGASYEAAPDVVVARVAPDKRNATDSFQILVDGKRVKTFYVRGRQKNYDEIIEALVDIVSEITGEEIMTKQETPLTLNRNGAAALRRIEDGADIRELDGRTLRSLADKKLAYDNGPRGWRLTSLGRLSLEAHEAKRGVDAATPRAVLHEHIPDPARLPAEPEAYRGALPDGLYLGEIPVSASPDIDGDEFSLDLGLGVQHVEASLEHAVPDTPPVPDETPTRGPARQFHIRQDVQFGVQTVELTHSPPASPTAGRGVVRADAAEGVVIDDPNRAQRILRYLMENSPFIRNLVAQVDALDRATERLRNLE